jgi:hypothetical protein
LNERGSEDGGHVTKSVSPLRSNFYQRVGGFTILSVLPFMLICKSLHCRFIIYTNTWIAKDGHAGSFGAMAGISAAVIPTWLPSYIYGKRIRHATQKWEIMKSIPWNIDRAAGE